MSFRITMDYYILGLPTLVPEEPYKTIAYLLEGKREAYNVTRRAIDWQNIEKKAFDEEMNGVQKELAEEENKQKNKGYDIDELNIKNIIADLYSAMDNKASKVASAYVNPFGYYVAGMIQEFESYNDSSLRHNARISYEKALELNPKSEVLQEAIKDLEKQNHPSGTKLVHVVVADGFVPEKKVLEFWLKAGSTVIPIRLPIYEPTPSKVSRIEIYSSGGKRLASLSQVADIEAICLRHQKDMQPYYTFQVTFAAARTFSEKKMLNHLGPAGDAISDARNKMCAPDTRSWMSLPASVQAARFYVAKGLKNIKIVTYNASGKKLASKDVDLDTSSHNFVYARSIDNILYTYSNKKLWLAN